MAPAALGSLAQTVAWHTVDALTMGTDDMHRLTRPNPASRQTFPQAIDLADTSRMTAIPSLALAFARRKSLLQTSGRSQYR